MLAGELATARDALFWRRRGPSIVRWLDGQPGDWAGPGTVALTDRHLALDGEVRRHASFGTVRGIERHDAYVWVERARAHDWLVRCRTEPDAERLVRMLAAAVAERRASSAGSS